MKDEPDRKRDRHDVIKAVVIALGAMIVIGAVVYVSLQLGIR